MASFSRALLVGIVASIAFVLYERSSHQLPHRIQGHADPRFAKVKTAFQQNFADGWEKGGASLTVYHHGEKVIDLWGGYADRASLRMWKEDTLQVVFSSTKGVGAVCVAMLVDRGHVSYDDLVTKHWPEFGQNGKGNVTVQMLISHASGLAYLDENIALKNAMNHRKISAIIEKQKPHWPPGTRTGYHILTQGWLLDQLIRRVDPKHRSIGQFIKEELHDAHDIDFHLGLPIEEIGRVARVADASPTDRISEILTDFRVFNVMARAIKGVLTDSLLSRALANMPWLKMVGQLTVNNPDLWRVEQASALGIGNARSLAKTYSLLSEGKLVSQKTLELLKVTHYRDEDLMLGVQRIKGNGFMYNPLSKGKPGYSMGHSGHGCQQGMVDLGNGIAVGYTNNALKTALGDLCRTWSRLQTAIYESIDL